MKKSFAFIIKREPNSYMKTGWGNGYVAVPQGHPWFGKHYDSIQADVHGGLTYSNKGGKGFGPSDTTDMWVVGFDTAHFNDTISSWPEEKVQEEADDLLAQANKAEIIN